MSAAGVLESGGRWRSVPGNSLNGRRPVRSRNIKKTKTLNVGLFENETCVHLPTAFCCTCEGVAKQPFFAGWMQEQRSSQQQVSSSKFE
jgi:hypothetical protein